MWVIISPTGGGFRLYLCLLLYLFSACTTALPDPKNSPVEQSICGLKEPIYFTQWSNAAGEPDTSRIAGIANIEDISLTTKDGRILRGYKLKASLGESRSTAKGYLLVVQGNAMLADQIIDGFQEFASSGYDVYLFDYRGYGRSEGKPRFKAILSDYGEIIDHLDSLSYSKSRFYGMSFGGVVLLDALKTKSGEKRAVIDSTRSRFSYYGCPEKHNPVRNLPEDCSNFLVIVGLADRVVTPEASKELLDTAHRRGASVLKDPQLGHPFMERDRSLHKRRMQAVRSFLFAPE